MDKLKVAILGSGNIGTDLLIKIIRSPHLVCSLFIGRDVGSRGIALAKSLNIRTSCDKVHALIQDPNEWDLVFDATSAEAHLEHWAVLKSLGKMMIDLTPSHIGKMAIPAVQLEESLTAQNINLISCGGQASIPLAYAIKEACGKIEYLEVVSSIASVSAGPATRINLDEYIENTERGLKEFSKASSAKAILILNPAEPKIHMQTTLYAIVNKPNADRIQSQIESMVKKLQVYVPGYQLIVPPIVEENKITITVKVIGLGDYLPSYAGNLDIINCAALTIAEAYAKKQSRLLCRKS